MYLLSWNSALTSLSCAFRMHATEKTQTKEYSSRASLIASKILTLFSRPFFWVFVKLISLLRFDFGILIRLVCVVVVVSRVGFFKVKKKFWGGQSIENFDKGLAGYVLTRAAVSQNLQYN